MLALQQSVERELEELGFASERRPFTPHLTLGRVRDGVRASQVRGVSEAIAATTVERRAELPVREVSLMQSDLRPSGAVYTRLYARGVRGWGVSGVIVTLRRHARVDGIQG